MATTRATNFLSQNMLAFSYQLEFLVLYEAFSDGRQLFCGTDESGIFAADRSPEKNGKKFADVETHRSRGTGKLQTRLAALPTS